MSVSMVTAIPVVQEAVQNHVVHLLIRVVLERAHPTPQSKLRFRITTLTRRAGN
ncbi:MAG: hypothetical protein WBH03_09905 [Cyclobacteriaceae bacterium]